ADAVRSAQSANPMLAAERLAADAAAERIRPAGTLPDPQLTLGLMNRPLSGFGTGERMTMNQVQLSQVVPWPGKLALARERAERLASAESLSAAEAEVGLVAQVTARYYELAAIDRTVTILERTRDLLRDFFDVSQTMYAVGQSPQQDVLQAQVAVAQMTEELTVMRQNRVATMARFNALLGQVAEAPVGSLDLPPIGGALPEIDSLMGLARLARPALLAAEERRRAAEVSVRAATRERYPDLMVGVAYGQRPQFDDMASLMIGLNLPLRAGARQIPLRREMEALEARSAALVTDLANETYAQLVEGRADAERARELGTLYATAIIPQAGAAVESALSAYRVGQVDYMTLVENQMTVNRYQIELVRITARFHQAVARIDALLGNRGEIQ
ncbi:MAG: TolC family protein, partial [Gemmatimonadota bacterium]